MRRALSLARDTERTISRSFRPYICTSCRRSLQQRSQLNFRPQARSYASDLSSDSHTPDTEPQFTPASTWDGLDHVGLEKPVSDYQFLPFSKEVRTNKLTEPKQIANAIHQAVVEVFTLKGAGMSMNTTREVLEHSDEALQAIKRTKIDGVTESGEAILSFHDAEARDLIVNELVGDLEEDATSQDPVDAQSSTSSDTTTTSKPSSPRRLPPPPNASPDSFNAISLSSLRIKFALIKRITHLTGHRIPDPTLTSMTTLRSVYDHLLRAAKPNPTKIAERLQAKEELASLRNVKISGKRQTIVQREKEVGRLKVIDEELGRRGLPRLEGRD
ncbi:MAG: hypothetical protein Q9160_001335 [Pyrenula sp. 1 TL-2023]